MKIIYQYRKPNQSWQNHGTGTYSSTSNETSLRLASMKKMFPEGTAVRAITETGQLVDLLM
jgi:hypothetical protein